jgi:hypothetical protein
MSIRWVCGLVIVFFLEALALPNVFSQSPAHQTASGIHEVEVTGSGMDEESALKAAFVKALERTVGTLIYSTTTTKNFQLESDVQKLLTNGCIESYDEIKTKQENGVVVKTIRARVRRGMVADFMKRGGYSGATDLSDTWARLATTIRGKKQAIDMLHEKMPQICDALYKVSLLDLASGRDVDGNTFTEPFTQENLDEDVVCVWAAVVKPDCQFWDTQAAPLLAACFDVLCEKKGRLFVNMNTGTPTGFENAIRKTGMAPSITRSPVHRWQRIPSDTQLPSENERPVARRPYQYIPPSPTVRVHPPWENAPPIKCPDSAPHCIALETRSSHPEFLDLSIYFFTDETYNRIMHPPEVCNSAGDVVMRPQSFKSMRTGLRASLSFKGGGQKNFVMQQSSPLFSSFSLPWPGGVVAEYCGPYFIMGSLTGGWNRVSEWPWWNGPVKPEQRVPGYNRFLVQKSRIHLATGIYEEARREMIHTHRGEFNGEMSQDCEFDLEVIAPLVFNLKLDELRRVQRLGVEPVTGTPPVEPGLGETLRKALKSWFSK